MTTINEVATIRLVVDAFMQHVKNKGYSLCDDQLDYYMKGFYLTDEQEEALKKEFMEIVQNKVINGIDPLID
jgi:hypothetical protein